jgi:hypothetical protein
MRSGRVTIILTLAIFLLICTPYVRVSSQGSRVVINEVELNPPGDDRLSTTMEWVELYNPTATPVDIGGWKVSTTHGQTVTVTIPPNTILQSGGYYIVRRAGWLDNEDECAVLRNAAGNEVDRTRTISDDDNDGRAWARFPNGKDTDSVGDWTFQTSTEEASNGEEPAEQSSSITCSTSSQSVAIGSQVAITGLISPAHVGVVVTLTFNPPNGSSTAKTTTSTSDGSYVYSMVPDAAGPWSVKASWLGDVDHKPAGSSYVSFAVSKAGSRMDLALSQERVSPGVSILISGSVSPRRPGAEVKLEYRPAGGSWRTIATVVPTAIGSFSYTWVEGPTDLGTYEIRASWAGDAQYNGTEKTLSLTVGKPYSSIRMESVTTNLTFGQTIVVFGAIDPSVGDARVTVSCTRPNGTSITLETRTAVAGSYSLSFQPDRAGPWTVKASWEGNLNYEGAESNALTFTVNKASVTVYTSLSRDSLDQGQSLRVSGSTSPPLSGILVLLAYQRSDGSTLMRSVTASTDGSFADDFTPDKDGRWTVTASWAGDADYLAAIGSLASFTVRQSFPLLYIVLGTAAVGVAVLLFVMRRRSRATPEHQPEPQLGRAT